MASENAPEAIGPYSQAIKAGNLVFCSGQIGLSPETGDFSGDDISSQTKQVLQNLEAVLQAAGSGLSEVVKVTIFLADINDYATVNKIYDSYFADIKPARSTVAVSALPKGALIEIECIAVVK